jgi:hypothetical protein
MASGSDELVPPPVNFNPGNTVCALPLVVEHCPLGEPGAPIPSEHDGSHVYHTSQEAFQSSIWAPFSSQCDWDIAHWAKMQGPMSSALADLLAIPEVSLSPIYQ